MNPFPSLAEYERFIYTLQSRYPSVSRSSLTVVRRGARSAALTGDLEVGGYRLVVREKLSFAEPAGQIISYGYEVWRDTEKLYWYDSQTHLDIPELASTHPHHKHVPPDIKHNRIPAPGITFDQPNLPFLIREIERLLEE
ncbi:MAG: DUF6516 family protein [Caldilineaceae bacterium]